MLRLVDLRCEHEQNPISIAAAHPRFSWKLESDHQDVVQAERHLQVARDPSFADPVWDSGWVRSFESHLVPYGGPALSTCTRYHYRVRVRDNHDAESGWSESAWFETAPGAWRAGFIGLDALAEREPSRPQYVRTEFRVDAPVRAARVYATALGVYELWLNGVRVGDAYLTPGWTSYAKRLQYQTYDVTQLLRRGPNAVGAIVAPGWYCGELTWLKVRGLYGSRPAVSLEVRIVDDAGRVSSIVTDRGWRGAPGPITYAELYHGEHYDARLEREGWSEPGFDASGWGEVAASEVDASRLIPQEGALTRMQERIAVQHVITTPSGETVLDFGQNLTGWVQFVVHGAAGERVVLRHAEVLDAAGNFYTENLRGARARVEYTLRGGTAERFEPHFTFHGFRYVHVEAFPGVVDPSAFTAVVLHSDMRPTLEFDCSNRLLNQLHHNILWGWKGNALDVPTDCPQRDERLGWTGDAQVFAGTAAYLMDTAVFFRKWLKDLASDQLDNGGVPFVIPDVLTELASKEPTFRETHSSTGWGDAAVVIPWTIYERYGDRELLRAQYTSMRAWVEYIRARAQNGVLWNSGFHFGDWVALDAKEGSYFGATPNDLTATAYYAFSALLLSRAARALDEARDAERYLELHRAIVEAFRNEFVTPSGRIASRTQTAHVLALVFDLAPPEHRARVARDLIALIDENGGHLTTGFLGTPFICRALAESGHLERAYALLLRDDYPSWLYQITKGATTVWEHWDGLKPDGTMWSPNMNSFNHYAYGAIGEWIYTTIGGLAPDPLEPGFHSFRIAPRPGGGITRASLSYTSPYGRITVEWRIERGELIVDAVVPANSTARIELAGVSARAIESLPERSVPAFRDGPKGAEAIVGSGRYSLRCPAPSDAARSD